MFDAKTIAVQHKRRVVQVSRNRGVEDDCPICLETLTRNPIVFFPCGHAIHLRCERSLRASECATKYRCSMCRTIVDRVCEWDVRLIVDAFLLLASRPLDHTLYRLTMPEWSTHGNSLEDVDDNSLEDIDNMEEVD